MKQLKRGGNLGKYRLEKKLGEGGSAVVWRARDRIEGRRVAIKVVLPRVVSEFGREAIEAEARIASQLEHPRIASIRNADWTDSHFVLVTDLATSSLDRYRGAQRSIRIALGVISDVAEGLAYAHSRGVIHRDIKPANIFLYDGRRARLGDFGTARLSPVATKMLTEAGTFGYMAPEQAYGRPRFASDVFSLALTAYELFSGKLPGWPFDWPLEGSRRFEARCPEPIKPVIRRGLELDLGRRWRDGIEFQKAFARALAKWEAGERARKAPSKSKKKSARPAKRGESDPFSLETQWFNRNYGKVFEARYDCHACDGPISESMSRCPWCGTDRNSFIEVTTFPIVCRDCERGVRPEWSACPTCATGRFVPNGKAIPARSTSERTCRHRGCDAPIHRFMRYCPACKGKVARPWRIPGLESCSRCHWPLGPRWRFCGWCGRKDRQALKVASKR